MIRSARLSAYQVLPLLIAAVLCGACSPNRPSVNELTLTAEPALFSATGGDVVVSAKVLASGGAPVAGVEVTFTTTGGTLSADKAATDVEGIARVRLAATQPVVVRAQAEGKQTELAIRPQTAVTVTFDPPEPRRNQLVTVQISLRTFGQSGSGQLSLSFGDGETVDVGQVTGQATTTHTWREDGGFNVTATLREGSQESKTTVRLEIRGFGPLDDQIDASQVTWLSPATTNVSDWAVTSEVHGASVNGSLVCIEHSKAGQWPLVSIDNNPPNIEANILIVVNVDGRWYGAGFDWLGGGRTCKVEEPTLYGRDQIRVPPLDASWPGPRSGDVVGLLITTPSSNRIPVRSVNERTPIVLITWP